MLVKLYMTDPELPESPFNVRERPFKIRQTQTPLTIPSAPLLPVISPRDQSNNLTEVINEVVTETNTVSKTSQDTSTTAAYGEHATVVVPSTTPVQSVYQTSAPQPASIGFIVNNVPVTSVSNNNVTLISTEICGQPGFCTNDIYANCPNTILSECQECDNGLAAVFMFFIICLGIAILLGNLLIILVGYRKHKENKKDKINVCKISLALADMNAGKLNISTYKLKNKHEQNCFRF